MALSETFKATKGSKERSYSITKLCGVICHIGSRITQPDTSEHIPL